MCTTIIAQAFILQQDVIVGTSGRRSSIKICAFIFMKNVLKQNSNGVRVCKRQFEVVGPLCRYMFSHCFFFFFSI